MKLLYIIYTYNRPKIFSECIRSLLNNNKTRPDTMVFCDDGSDINFKGDLFNLSLRLTSLDFLSHFYSAGRNLGYGANREIGDSFVEMFEPDFFAHIETDYIWRRGGIDEAILLLEKYCPNAIGMSLFSNPDEFDKTKTHEMYSQILKDDFGEDNTRREFLHLPYDVDTEEYGKIKCLSTTNTCGTFLINNKNLKKLTARFPEMREDVFKKSCQKYRPNYSDGTNTHGISHYFYKYHNEIGTDYADMKNAPWISIIDTPISRHISGGGLNSKPWAEGTSQLETRGWPEDYNNFKRAVV